MPDFSIEEKYQGIVVGIDEVGCGPWAGPVVAGAAILVRDKIPESLLKEINDSKKLTRKKREKIHELLTAPGSDLCYSATGQCSVEEIDELNIRRAALLAMKRAVEGLSIKPAVALVDGTAKPNITCQIQMVTGGDSLSYSIAAASIIAKVTRDRLMGALALKHPYYKWETNAGYGTADHQAALERYGITPHHRKSFAPIARLLAA